MKGTGVPRETETLMLMWCVFYERWDSRWKIPFSGSERMVKIIRFYLWLLHDVAEREHGKKFLTFIRCVRSALFADCAGSTVPLSWLSGQKVSPASSWCGLGFAPLLLCSHGVSVVLAGGRSPRLPSRHGVLCLDVAVPGSFEVHPSVAESQHQTREGGEGMGAGISHNPLFRAQEEMLSWVFNRREHLRPRPLWARITQELAVKSPS